MIDVMRRKNGSPAAHGGHALPGERPNSTTQLKHVSNSRKASCYVVYRFQIAGIRSESAGVSSTFWGIRFWPAEDPEFETRIWQKLWPSVRPELSRS